MTRPLAIAAALALAACATRPAPAPPLEPAAAAATFDAAWDIVHRTHFDTTFNGVDWRAVREELRPRAESARTRAELRATIRAMLARLGQSHFALIPQETAEPGDTARDRASLANPGLDLRYVEGRLVVSGVRPGGPAERAGVRVGWTVEGVGEEEAARIVERVAAQPSHYRVGVRAARSVLARMQGPPGAAVAMRFRDADGRAVPLELAREAEDGQLVRFGNLPPFISRFDWRRERAGEAGIAVFRWNNWMVPLMRQVDAAMDSARDARGWIIDLRGNPGGVGQMTMGVAGHFIARPDTFGTMMTRAGRIVFVVNPRRVAAGGRRAEPFAGPVAVLVDGHSGSASEVFAGGVQSLGRVRVFGDTTIGGVLPAVTDRLPNRDVLYHAIGDFRTARGEYLEGRGVVPDEVVVPARSDYVAGRDPVLEAARRWLIRQINANASGGTP